MYLAYIFVFLELLLLLLSFQKYINKEYLKKVSSCILIVVLTFISGFRYNVGADFMAYEQIYLDPSIANIEPIWHFIYKLLHNMGLSSVSWFFLTSFIINFFFISGIRDLSKNFYLSVAFYIAMPHLFLESFNGVRQFVAISIIFRFSYLFFQKKYIKFIIVILIAACFHKSVILAIPLYFMSLINFSNIILTIVVFFCFIFRNSFLPIINVMISKVSMYSQYINISMPSKSNTGMYAYVLLFVCLFIIFYFRKPESREINVLKNFSLMSFCIYLLFYTFLPGQRIGFYFLPYFVILVPYIQSKANLKKSYATIGGLFIAFFLFTLKSGFYQLYSLRF